MLDTDVLVAAFRSERGASRALLLAAMRMTDDEVRSVLAALAAVSEPVLVHFLWRPVLTDADDEHVLDLAMNGRADLLVTFNQADFTAASGTLHVEVVTPSAMLGKLR